MPSLPPCPQCTLENTYPDGANIVCADSIVLTLPSSTNSVDAESVIAGVTLAAYPNPSGAEATVRIELPRRIEGATVRIVDAKGGELLRVADGATFMPGTTTIPLDLAALPSGVYHIMLEVAGEVVSARMTVLR